jgi:hypothetical protein
MNPVSIKVLFLGAVVMAAGCSSGSRPPPGKPCLVNSECAEPLVCSSGRCHVACKEARDCPTGELCVKGPSGAVCQLPAESRCEYRSQCPSPLTCAIDRRCRSECLGDVDCPTATQRCLLPDRVCAEPGEIDPGTLRLRNAQPTPVPGEGGAADAGGTDGPVGGGPDGGAPEAAAGSCTDRIRNGSETDVDCGGGACPACALGKACGGAGDCGANLCVEGKCFECAPGSARCSGKRSSSCMNGVWVQANDECATGCDEATGKCRVCPASTCQSVRVIFRGAVASKGDVALAVDNGSVHRTATDSDPMIGQKNVLYGNFTPDGKQYTSDNTACGLPDFGARTNVYYLAPLDGLPVASTWYASPDPFKEERYCQSCPNYGCDNFISTPKRIEKIEILATSGDLTCKVCLYRSAPASADSLIRCVPPNTTLSGPDLDAMVNAPGLIQLDDGMRCGSY